jgi:O-antigen ligase
MQSNLVALDVFSDYPILGSGIGAIYPRSQRMIRALGVIEVVGLGVNMMIYGNQATLSDPHNFYLLWLSELGLLGSLALLLFAWFFIRPIRAALKAPEIPGDFGPLYVRGLATGLLLFMAQLTGASMLLNNDRVSVVFWMFAAVTATAATRVLARRVMVPIASGRDVASLAPEWRAAYAHQFRRSAQ